MRGSRQPSPVAEEPAKTADEYLDTLLKQGLTQTVGLLREWKVAI
jgi:hypothetical protein